MSTTSPCRIFIVAPVKAGNCPRKTILCSKLITVAKISSFQRPVLKIYCEYANSIYFSIFRFLKVIICDCEKSIEFLFANVFFDVCFKSIPSTWTQPNYLGGLTLLFVAYQLWGTGVLTDRYQSDLEEDFTELIEVVEESTSTTDAPKTSDTDISNYAELLWRPEGQAMAQIVIPKIGLTATVVSGVSSESLRRGPGHFPDTPMPGMPGILQLLAIEPPGEPRLAI